MNVANASRGRTVMAAETLTTEHNDTTYLHIPAHLVLIPSQLSTAGRTSK